jgi:flagellar biosynthesis/type III secretory pathway chaperone
MTLKTLFERQLSLLEQLLALLDREQQQLSARAPDGAELASIASRKQQLFERIESLETSRLRVQRSLGLGEDRHSTASSATASGCLDTWKQVQEVAQRVYRLNRLNGDLIRTRMSANQKILTFLQDTREVTLYRRDGQSGKARGTLHSSA